MSRIVSPARPTWHAGLDRRRIVDQALDFLGRLRAALRQRTHLARHHGEALPPARSTAAFSARILVWKAMLSTTPTISPMRRALSAMPRMLCTTSSTAWPLGQLVALAPGGWPGRRCRRSAARYAPAASCWRRFRNEPACARWSDMSAPPAAISPEPGISSTPWRTEATASVSRHGAWPNRARRSHCRHAARSRRSGRRRRCGRNARRPRSADAGCRAGTPDQHGQHHHQPQHHRRHQDDPGQVSLAPATAASRAGAHRPGGPRPRQALPLPGSTLSTRRFTSMPFQPCIAFCMGARVWSAKAA